MSPLGDVTHLGMMEWGYRFRYLMTQLYLFNKCFQVHIIYQAQWQITSTIMQYTGDVVYQ